MRKQTTKQPACERWEIRRRMCDGCEVWVSAAVCGVRAATGLRPRGLHGEALHPARPFPRYQKSLPRTEPRSGRVNLQALGSSWMQRHWQGPGLSMGVMKQEGRGRVHTQRCGSLVFSSLGL